MVETSARTLSCRNCGHPFTAHPPDDSHIVVKLEPCTEGDSIEIQYECDNCHQRNTIHWDRRHSLFVKTGGFKSH